MTPSDDDFQRLADQVQEILRELSEFKREARDFRADADEQFRAVLGVDGMTRVLEHGLADHAEVKVMLASGFKTNAKLIKTLKGGFSENAGALKELSRLSRRPSYKPTEEQTATVQRLLGASRRPNFRAIELNAPQPPTPPAPPTGQTVLPTAPPPTRRRES